MASKKKLKRIKQRIIKQHDSKCQSCGYKGTVDLHHIIPKNKGGNDNEENLMLLCYPCHLKIEGRNMSESSNKYWEWIQQKDRGIFI